MTSYKLRINNYALSDHMDRLYDLFQTGRKENQWFHIDGPESGVITIIKIGDKATQVEMSKAAALEFISDMDYQVEVHEDYDTRAYRNQCKRALTSVRKQIAQEQN